MDTLAEVPRDISILVVDDIPSARNVVIRLLKKLGFENVNGSSQGAEALELLDGKAFDVVITDLHLKDMLGIELIQKTRQKEANQDMPFIVITSDMSRNAFDEVMKTGSSTYLLKPFSKGRLAEKLVEVLMPSHNAF